MAGVFTRERTGDLRARDRGWGKQCEDRGRGWGKHPEGQEHLGLPTASKHGGEEWKGCSQSLQKELGMPTL